MKASIKFRDEQKPLLRAKIPLNVLSVPFQSGISAGESKELTLNLSTFFGSGPLVKFSYRPNDSHNPFSFIIKTGIGHFGSPTNSPLTMRAEFNLIGNQNPSFFIHFKPNLGDFSLRKSHSSGLIKGLGEKLNGEGLVNGFFPSSAESKSAAGLFADGFLKGSEFKGILRGSEFSAKTSLPLRDIAVVNFRWGLSVPPQEATAEETDMVIVGKKREGTAGIRLPLLVMNKIGIEYVPKVASKGEKVQSDVADACMEVKKKLDVIQAENGLLTKALSDLRSEITAGKMDLFAESQNRYSGGAVDRRGSPDKKWSEGKGFGGKSVTTEGNKELKA